MTPISPARVQDWLNAALTPMIEGLKREVELTRDRYFWQPNTGRFEFFYPLADYVLDEDNLEDLEEHNAPTRAGRLGHDTSLEALRAALSAAFAAARNDAETARAARSLLPQSEDTDLEYLLGYVAEGVSDAGDNRPARLWKPRSAEILAQFDAGHPAERAAVTAAGHELRSVARGTLAAFKQTRRVLADTYEIRLKPAGIGW